MIQYRHRFSRADRLTTQLYVVSAIIVLGLYTAYFMLGMGADLLTPGTFIGGFIFLVLVGYPGWLGLMGWYAGELTAHENGLEVRFPYRLWRRRVHYTIGELSALGWGRDRRTVELGLFSPQTGRYDFTRLFLPPELEDRLRRWAESHRITWLGAQSVYMQYLDAHGIQHDLP